jgi:mono/diheme cytochrome c family protein
MSHMIARLFILVLLIVAATLTASLAMAQSASRGATYYQSFPASCSDCHGADPKKDQYANTKSGGVRAGANRPDLITGAITSPGAYTDGKTDMFDLLYPLYIQNQSAWDAMIADIAAYLGQVLATPLPPPPTAGQLGVPGAIAFASQAVGSTSPPRTVTLTNVGGASVSIAGVASSNATEFALVSSSCNGALAAAASCQFELIFTPGVAGARSATVTVTSDGTGSPQTIAVTGNGSAVSPSVAAQEFYHAGFDHYFVTAIAAEITMLGNGTFAGWAPTGHSFNVYPLAGAPAGTATVCRFFSTTFAPKSSHFYTPSAPECAMVKSNANWSFEGEVFNVPAAAADGSCPPATQPVYRLYNNGQGAAPNHRYTTDTAIRTQMIAKGWVPEGYGAQGVIMCSPQ